MKAMQRSKSRAKLYNLMAGTNELTGAAGVLANWTILFNAAAANADTVTVGGFVFQFVTDGLEDTPGDSAGTAADPHLVTIGSSPTSTTAATNLTAALLAETATTGAWGFIYPDDSVGASSSTATITINFWPGDQADGATYITDVTAGTDPTITNVSDGTVAKAIAPEYKYNMIDTTGSAQNKEVYVLHDGEEIGDTVKIVIKAAGGSDTPAIIGHLEDSDGTDYVEALFTTADTGQYAEFMWFGTRWSLLDEGQGTALTWLAA